MNDLTEYKRIEVKGLAEQTLKVRSSDIASDVRESLIQKVTLNVHIMMDNWHPF